MGSNPVGVISSRDMNRLEKTYFIYADVAQLAEQLICNQQVNGSSPFIGFIWPGGSVG